MNNLSTSPASVESVASEPPKSGGVSQHRIAGLRKVKDSVANVTITAGGMAVLFAILLIFFYLLYEILPMFTPASVDHSASYRLDEPAGSSARPLYLGMEEQAEVAMRLDDLGAIRFFRAENGEPISGASLPLDGQKVTGFALNSEQQPLMALASDKQVFLV